MRHTLAFHAANLGRKLQKFANFKSPLASLCYSQSYALIIIASEKNLTQAQIAARLNLDPASVVSLIDELEEDGLVKRRDSSNDRRKHQVILTVKGRKILNQVEEKTRRLDDFLKDKLTKDEIENFNMTLDKVNLYINQWKGGDK